VRKSYVNFAIANCDLFHDGFDYSAPVLDWQFGPTGIKSFGFGYHFFGRKALYL